jgi:hypothetical protein
VSGIWPRGGYAAASWLRLFPYDVQLLGRYGPMTTTMRSFVAASLGAAALMLGPAATAFASPADDTSTPNPAPTNSTESAPKIKRFSAEIYVEKMDFKINFGQ